MDLENVFLHSLKDLDLDSLDLHVRQRSDLCRPPRSTYRRYVLRYRYMHLDLDKRIWALDSTRSERPGRSFQNS